MYLYFSVSDVLAADRQLAKEIEFDLRKFEEQQAEAALMQKQTPGRNISGRGTPGRNSPIRNASQQGSPRGPSPATHGKQTPARNITAVSWCI